LSWFTIKTFADIEGERERGSALLLSQPLSLKKKELMIAAAE
jgi:hypothetical protein